MIIYQQEEKISIDEFKKVLINSTLGEKRPVNDDNRLLKMIENSNLLFTARDNGKLIGIARSLTDFQFCTYLSDLAVDVAYQKKGIGKELIRQTKLKTPNAFLVLLAAPEAEEYYPKIGMNQFEQCYYINDVKKLQ